ncbi:hypothetical protein [Paenibacillus ehimensis]|uniref:hypothetical protein n=1 Tax=Paenibacillus ehimensis TaxID=79264 RepID=UPI000FDBB2C7|nr:hypothetical protein [Paenibacillus ehimensis]
MDRIQELLMKKNQLMAIMQMMDRDASFDTEEGRVYAQYLVRTTLIQLEIDELNKEKAAQ